MSEWNMQEMHMNTPSLSLPLSTYEKNQQDVLPFFILCHWICLNSNKWLKFTDSQFQTAFNNPSMYQPAVNSNCNA